MDRDEAAALLFVLVGGALLFAAGVLVPVGPATDEQTAWRRAWLPALPTLLPLAFLSGFAIADHEGAQSVATTRLVATLPFAAIGLRAVLRGIFALFRRSDEPAVTMGLLRPRIVVTDALRSALDDGELRAVLAHEAAHARHRDPLRMWLVARLTDLQWPLPSARARQRLWLDALELARDDEATRTPGVTREDLASALVKAARFATTCNVAGAALTRHDALLALRVRRLLAPAKASAPQRSMVGALVVGLAIVTFFLGLAASAEVVAFLAGTP